MLTDSLAFSLHTFTPLLRSSFMTVMPSSKDTGLNPDTKGQVANSIQMSCTAGPPQQASAIESSTVSWHQINRPWGDQHKSAGSSSGIKAAEGMDPSKIPNYPPFLVIQVTGHAGSLFTDENY